MYKDKRDIYDKILGYLEYTNIPEKLNRDYVDSLYKLPLTGSVSKLEKYANCPFSYFVRYGLRPEERKYYKVELPDIGIIFHDSLEKFGRKVFSKNLNWRDINRDMSDKMAEEIVDEIVGKYYDKVFLSTNSNKYLINKIKRVVKRSVWVTSNQLRKGKFDPKAFEIEFSDSLRNDVVPPIVIDIDGKEKIYLEGRIDRLDLVDIEGKKYARIIDYKSSDKKYSLSDVFNGLQMQLMIYMDAVIENSSYFKENEIYPGGVFYFKIDDPLIESNERRLEVIEDEIVKRLKLEGIVVDDINVIEAVDSNILETKNSEIVSVKLNSSGSVRKDSQTIALEDFEKLMIHVKNNIADIGSNIVSGDISIFPVKSGDKKACDYCKYSEICQFDEKIKGNKYRRVKKYSDDEVIEKVSGKLE
jgi:ATP-dependent helicase/nuclease subunit B